MQDTVGTVVALSFESSDLRQRTRVLSTYSLLYSVQYTVGRWNEVLDKI
jgi:hypothetical protein